MQEKNPLDISDLKQCDPYSSFGVFCNANSFIEGIIIISCYFVCRKYVVCQEKPREYQKRKRKPI
jgi:hypothetical protein